MLTTEFFLAFRYLKPKRTFVSVITLLSVLGPVLGVAILLIVSSVMAGFDRDIRDGIMNMQAHISVYPRYEKYILKPGPLLEKMESHAGVYGTPVIESAALIQLRDQIFPKQIRGIVPGREMKVTSLLSSLLIEQSEALKDGEVIIGDRLASETGLRAGKQMLIHSPARLTENIRWLDDGQIKFEEPEEMYLPEETKVVNYFSLGVADYDGNIILMTLDQAAELNGMPWGSATSLQLSVPDPLNMDALTAQLRNEFPQLEFVTWQERNQMLFGTLRVEKNLMTFLMAFIVLVASFAIAATLITVVVQKTREIGILKAVGTSSGTIARIFLFQGAIIGCLGTVCGTILGLLVLACRNQVADFLSFVMGHDVFPAELYHLTKIPAYTSWQDLLMIVLLSFAICIFSALIPAIYASALKPARSLQEEN